MAKQANVFPSTSTPNSSFVRADAFLRLTLTDNSGNKFKFSKDLPLHIARSLDANVIAAAKENPDLEFAITGTVFIVSPESNKVPDFG